MPDTITWQITNNCTATDIIVIDASSIEALPSAYYYEQTLVQLKPSEDQPSILKGTSAQVLLPAAHVDEENDTQDYTIILADADTLSPIKLFQLKANAGSYADATVDNTDIDSIKTALTFLQTIAAYPSSDLAVNYTTAVQSPDPDATDIFFEGTTTFKDVALEQVEAVSSYLKVFPYYWIGTLASREYHIYTSDNSTGEPNGKITMENKCSKPLTVDKAPKDFTVTLKMSEGNDVKLHYTNGQFIDDPVNDVNKVCLMASFAIESQLSKNDADTDTVPYLTGTIDGNTAFGLADKVPDKNDEDDGFYDIFHPDNIKGYLDLAVYVVTVLMSIQALVAFALSVRWAYRKIRKVPDEDTVDLDKRFAEVNTRITNNTELILKRVNASAASPEALKSVPKGDFASSVLPKVKQLLISDNIQFTRASISQTVSTQQEYVLELLKTTGNLPSLTNVTDNLSAINDQITNITDPFEFATKISSIKSVLSLNTSKLNTVRTDSKYHFTDAQKIKFTNSDAMIAAQADFIDKNEKAREAIENGEDFEMIER